MDTFLDTSLLDPNANHFSVHTNQTGSNSANENFSLNYREPNCKFRNNIFNVTIDYDQNYQILSVFLDNAVLPILTAETNLSAIFDTNDQVWIGFSSSTNDFPDVHSIISWNFTYSIFFF